MKKTVLFALSILLLISCGKDKKDSTLYNTILSTANPKGILSCYSGKINTSSSAIYFRKNIKYSTSDPNGPSFESYVYIKSIEISTTGEQWIKIVDGPIAVKAKYAEVIRISSSVYIPPDEYHAIRMSLENKIRFLDVSPWSGYGAPGTKVDVTLENVPIDIQLYGTSVSKKITSLENITLTSANGLITPFDIETGKETSLIFEFQNLWSGSSIQNIGEWRTGIYARSSRFLY